MLRSRIVDLLDQDVKFEKIKETINKQISEIIKNTVSQKEISILMDFLGPEASKNYLTEAEIEQSFADLKAQKADYDDVICQYFTTKYLQLAFYYACKMGSLKLVKYFIEELHLPGDLQVSVGDFQKNLGDKEIKGTPLSLAVESNNLDLVKYIYENSEATVEVGTGQPLERNPVMRAVEAGNNELVAYLLAHGGNPNAEQFASWSTVSPLTIAIYSGNSSMVQLLVNSGAIVSNEEVNLAIHKNLELETINYLMQASVNREDAYSPYIISALKSGNIDLFNAMQNNDMVKQIAEIEAFSEKPIQFRLLRAGGESGSLEMMKYLIEEKKLDIKQILLAEYSLYENIKSKNYGDIKEITKLHDTVLYHCACNNDRKNVVPVLDYLFKLQKPSAEVARVLCENGIYEIHAVAYLHSLITHDPKEKAMLESIAFHFEELPLEDLFKIYNSKFAREGNHYERHGGRNFMEQIEVAIRVKAEKLTAPQLLALVKKDKEIAIGALFYYCSSEFNEHSEKLTYLLSELTVYSDMFKNVDIRNYRGDTLASFARYQNAYAILKQLLARGANPDATNNEGETLLNPIIDFSYLREREFDWIKNYINHAAGIQYAVRNTLLYETKREMGGNEGIKAILQLTEGKVGNLSLAELIQNCKKGWNNTWKIEALLKNLSEDYYDELKKLEKDRGFNLDVYFDRFKNHETKKEKQDGSYGNSSPRLYRDSGNIKVEAENKTTEVKMKFSTT